MNDSRVSFLRQLVASSGPSGFEQPVQQVIREEVAHYSDDIHTDVHGNVIVALHPTTDTDTVQIVRGGIATGLVSIPCRYLHTGSEIASLKDMDETATVLTRFVLALNADINVIP